MLRAGVADDYAWSVAAEAYEYRGGACLGCPHVAPGAGQGVAQLRFEFLQRSLARVRVGDGPWTIIRPYTYGVPSHAEFAPIVSFPVPDMEGPWVLVFQDTAGHGDLTSRYAYNAHASFDLTGIDNDDILIGFSRSDSAPESMSVGRLRCLPSSDGTPLCKYSASLGRNGSHLVQQKEFLLPLGNISASRFKGEAADGETVEGFRIDHD